MKDINTIAIGRNDYDSAEEFENAIKRAIMVLLENGYIMTVRYDCHGREHSVAVIDFNHADPSIGTDYPYWLSMDEIESVFCNKDMI